MGKGTIIDSNSTKAADPASAQYGPIFGDAALRSAYAAHLAEVSSIPDGGADGVRVWVAVADDVEGHGG